MSKKMKYELSPQENSMLKKMFWRSWTLFGSFNMVKMQGYGFSQAMMPAIDNFYKNEEDKRKALVRSSTFFNCTYETAPFIMGLNAAMEKSNSEHSEFDVESINAVKASLMGPLSGIGDSIFWGTVRLIAASIGIPLAMKGSILGPLIFLLIYHIPSIITRYQLLYVGYATGEKFLTNAYKSGVFEKLTYSATMVGMMMIGAMTAQSVTISTPLKIALGGKNPLVIQDILNTIMPGLLPLLVMLTVFYLIRKKVKIVYLLLGIIAVGILGSLIGIL
ncbi:PTS system mannose/fructose/sorbose family transporter subunit IID [Thermoanaerobacterium thermosaccharolyticum]|uniref:PTS system mannose/fructose/sorbose family transporter subunit IID n=1 Tax=Thermoanaerobacterium thermosaccharolyticum TaxID=1517 RepID=UPI001CC20BFD|nr:PTS system mannose/fructose/sorbose family transporter subunit IID [Thermoanaerobacterium thermosaccharolyticum]